MLADEVVGVVARRGGLIPRLRGSAPALALVGVVGVPLLVGLCPPWLRRWTIPMLTITSIGVVATVPDIEHVVLVMVFVVLGAVVAFVTAYMPPPLVSGAIAFAIIVAALADSAGRPAPIARTIGCFAALLAVPVAGFLAQRNDQRHPQPVIVVAIHAVVALFCSRALIREQSALLVTGVVGVALLATVGAVYAASHR